MFLSITQVYVSFQYYFTNKGSFLFSHYCMHPDWTPRENPRWLALFQSKWKIPSLISAVSELTSSKLLSISAVENTVSALFFVTLKIVQTRRKSHKLIQEPYILSIQKPIFLAFFYRITSKNSNFDAIWLMVPNFLEPLI